MNQGIPLFRLNYALVNSYIPMDSDHLVKFAITFSNDNEALFFQPQVVTHICLVLDVSGSMDVPNKYPYLLKSIIYVIEALSDNDWISIILFSSYSELVWSKDVASSRGREREIVQCIEQSGVKFERTNLAPGLQIAMNIIKYFSQSKPTAVTRLYILTDGQLDDASECYNLNPELQSLEIEVNSYGFGEDFAEETIRKIMEGCPGKRIKQVLDTNTLRDSFRHIGEVARNIVATEAELELSFPSNITPGDAFRFEPGTNWLGSISDRSKNFGIQIGALEKGRTYKYAFEVRVYPSSDERHCIASTTLRYSFLGEQQIIKQDIFVNRTEKQWLYENPGMINKEIQNWFLVLEGLRSNDSEFTIASLQARLRILVNEGGDPDQIQLLEEVIKTLQKNGTLEGISELTLRRLRSDGRTSLKKAFQS